MKPDVSVNQNKSIHFKTERLLLYYVKMVFMTILEVISSESCCEDCDWLHQITCLAFNLDDTIMYFTYLEVNYPALLDNKSTEMPLF